MYLTSQAMRKVKSTRPRDIYYIRLYFCIVRISFARRTNQTIKIGLVTNCNRSSGLLMKIHFNLRNRPLSNTGNPEKNQIQISIQSLINIGTNNVPIERFHLQLSINARNNLIFIVYIVIILFKNNYFISKGKYFIYKFIEPLIFS